MRISNENSMYPLILRPILKNYLWGGTKLKKEYGKQSDENIAESWELCSYQDQANMIQNGIWQGKYLNEYIASYGKQVLGTRCKDKQLPVLIKYIDAQDFLSIQVHPGMLYAQTYEQDMGKTEAWYVIDCEPDAWLYYGFYEEMTKKQFVKAAQDGSIVDRLNKVSVAPGDMFFIPPGMVHAIGKGILMAEVGTNSNITYRIFDYGRKDKYGKERELHLDKAAEVIQFGGRKDFGYKQNANGIKCDDFQIEILHIEGQADLAVNGDTFISLLVFCGGGDLSYNGNKIPLRKGMSLFLPANMGSCRIVGNLKAVKTTI